MAAVEENSWWIVIMSVGDAMRLVASSYCGVRQGRFINRPADPAATFIAARCFVSSFHGAPLSAPKQTENAS
jgi:hypothetical protein